jgi:hypothetical protein
MKQHSRAFKASYVCIFIGPPVVVQANSKLELGNQKSRPETGFSQFHIRVLNPIPFLECDIGIQTKQPWVGNIGNGGGGGGGVPGPPSLPR